MNCVFTLFLFTILYHLHSYTFPSLVACESSRSRSGTFYFVGSSVPRTGLSTCWAIICRVSILCKAQVPLGGVEEWSDSKESHSHACLSIHSFVHLENCPMVLNASHCGRLWGQQEKWNPTPYSHGAPIPSHGKEGKQDFWWEKVGMTPLVLGS